MRAKLLQPCPTLHPWTVARQDPLSVGLSRQESWNGLPCPPPGDLPDPGIEPASPVSPALQAGSFLLNHQGNPEWISSPQTPWSLGILLVPSNPQPATVLCSKAQIPMASLIKNLPRLVRKLTEALWGAAWQSPLKQDKTKPRLASIYSDPVSSIPGIYQRDPHRCWRRNVQNANALHLENG